MPTAQQLLKDPEFHRLPFEERRTKLTAADPQGFAAFPAIRQERIIRQSEAKFAPTGIPQPPPVRPTSDIALGWRTGLAGLETTAANILGALPPTRGAAESLRRTAEATMPKPEELVGRTGLGSQLLQAVGQAPAAIVKYTPAAKAGKFAPLVAAGIGAVSEAHRGPAEAGQAAARDLATFWALGKTARIPSRVGRAAASGAVAAVPTVIETRGDIAATGAAGIMGGTFGAVSGKPRRPLTQAQVAAAAKGGIGTLGAYRDSVRTFFAPQSRTGAAKETAAVFRARLSDIYQSADIAEFAMKEARGSLDKLGVIDRYDFIDRIENHRPQPTRELQSAADVLTKIGDDKAAQVEQVTGRMVRFYQDYFPHIWKDPRKAQQFVQNWYAGKRPLPGPRGFLKPRTHPTLRDGLAAGLEPVTENPVDWVLLKRREMDRFMAAHLIIDDLKAAGIAKFVASGYAPPAGHRIIQDPAFAIYRGRGKVARAVGHWALPDEAATVAERVISPGLRGNKLLQHLMGFNNFLNQSQLGWSLFHLGFTSIDAATSQWALGIEQVVHGMRMRQPKFIAQGVASLAKTPVAPVANAMRGYNVQREWRQPGSTGNPQLALMVQLMKEAGGRATLDPIYRNNMIRRFQEALREGKTEKAALRAIPALTEWAAKPLMEHIVPWQKLGVFSEMARFELERLPPNAPRNQVRQVMAKAWDSVDNRMGQLVYDNLFWNRWFKDLSMISIRSVGWNLGTIRELAGGATDSLAAARNVLSGKPWEFTHRMAYMTALPMVVGTIGAITHYLFNGKPPDTLTDYFFPRTGRKDEFGRDERLSMPSYMKDIYHYTTSPGRTAAAKLHPTFNVLTDMLANQDFYGVKVLNEDDPWMDQVKDAGIFMAGQLLPISVRTIGRERKMDYPVAEQIMAFFGFIPAPSDIKRTHAERMVSEMLGEKLPRGARTKEQAQRLEIIRDIERAIRTGKDPLPLFDQGVREGRIIPRDVETAIRRASTDPFERGFKQLTLEQAVEVMETATPAERERLMRTFQEKFVRQIDTLGRIPQPRRGRIANKILELMEGGR